MVRDDGGDRGEDGPVEFDDGHAVQGAGGGCFGVGWSWGGVEGGSVGGDDEVVDESVEILHLLDGHLGFLGVLDEAVHFDHELGRGEDGLLGLDE